LSKKPHFTSNYGRGGSGSGSASSWLSGALAIPAAGLVTHNYSNNTFTF